MTEINIVCATDNRYAPYYGIMLTSLFINNTRIKIHVFFLIGENLSQQTYYRFNQLAESYHHDIQYVKVDESILCNCPIRIGDHVSLATYFRLIAPVLLPEYIDKVLYLDGDIIVDDSIMDLWNTDVSNVAIAAVTDESYRNPEVYERLGLDNNIPYTSAGVLIMNLGYWRDHNVIGRCLDCIERQKNKLLFHDQDTLNIVCQYEKSILPAKFNLQSGFLRPWNFQTYDSPIQKEIADTLHSPVIIHYSGPGKPWLKYNDHPYKSYYYHYKKQSLWKDYPQLNTYNAESFAHDIVGRALRFFNIKPKLYIISPIKKKW